MIIPLVGRNLTPTTNDVTAREIQVLIDAAELLPKLNAWFQCTRCGMPLNGANGFEDPVWTLQCGCTIHRFQRKPI